MKALSFLLALVMLFIFATLLGAFSMEDDTASISFDSIWQQDTIRIQFSLEEDNYTTSSHHIFKLEKEGDGFKAAYYFSNHMDDPAGFEKNINFSRNDIERLTNYFIDINREEDISGWICFVSKIGVISISYQNKKHSFTSFEQDNIENIKAILLGKIYANHFSSTLSWLKSYWK